VGNLRVGAFPLAAQTPGGIEAHRHTLGRMASAGVDHACAGDHVSFFVGAGSDGLVAASSLLSLHAELPVYVALYLLPLRHPVPVARSLATIAEIAPGRLTLGVGIGGEDRHEIEVCGVDPQTRGRRMDECLQIVRALLRGEPLTFHGEFFSLEEALILPAAQPPIPLIVGGRSQAAVRRAGRLGDGWLGIWVSPRRFAAVSEEISVEAANAGRDQVRFEHAMNVWCGFDKSPDVARALLAEGMEAFYRIGFENFERYSPFGSPEDVAGFLDPYVDAGCSVFNIIPCARDEETAVAAIADVRSILGDSRGAGR
jgi:alkanesulfonate monooxygenase SsuD/methylene tetrahydromethanopterin reductase-like flavin-dependent oxidoreductase (luciferase family)